MPTTASDVVAEPVSRALSRTRIRSPPMLLGRKLLKKVATRYDAESGPIAAANPWARSSRCQRQMEMSSISM